MSLDISAGVCRYRGSNAQYRLYRSRLSIMMVTFELEGEAEVAVVASELPLHIIGVVADIAALPDPPHSSCQGCLLGVDERLHADVVETVWLEQVDYVKSVLDVLARVGY